jgi:hypothetical protein
MDVRLSKRLVHAGLISPERSTPLQQKRDALERGAAVSCASTHAFAYPYRVELIETFHWAISIMQYGARTLRGTFGLINVLQYFVAFE